VLTNPSIASKLEDTKALSELKVLENFYKILQSESTRAFYGISHVEKANEALAIETLLITDSLFRLEYSIMLLDICL
jgi:protein pelota